MLTTTPRKGDRVSWPNGRHAGTVLRVDGNLCWYQPDHGEAAPFIWRFPREGVLNQLATVVER